MITFIKSKYSDTSDGRDTLLKITQIENLIRPDSFFSYLCALRITEDMPENVRFSQKDTDKFLILKNKIPWTIKKPYIRFEAEILPVMDEIGYHLNAKKTSSLEKYNAKVIEAERLIEKYAEDSCMVDPEIFIEFHNKLNLLKDILRRDSYVFYELRSDEMFDELNRINTDNKEKYTNIYFVAKKKYEVSKNFFAKYKDYIGPKEIKTLQEQYLLIDKLFQSRRYDLMNKAVELINRTDSKITEIVNAKKQNMIINLNRQIDKLKPSIWLEDWEILKKNVSVMIKEAEETGSLLNLNLDRYHLDRKIYEKKDEVLKLITLIKSKNSNNYSSLISRAERFFNEGGYRNDFYEFQKQINPNIGSNIVGIISSKAEKGKENGKTSGFLKSIFGKKD